MTSHVRLLSLSGQQDQCETPTFPDTRHFVIVHAEILSQAALFELVDQHLRIFPAPFDQVSVRGSP